MPYPLYCDPIWTESQTAELMERLTEEPDTLETDVRHYPPPSTEAAPARPATARPAPRHRGTCTPRPDCEEDPSPQAPGSPQGPAHPAAHADGPGAAKRVDPGTN